MSELRDAITRVRDTSGEASIEDVEVTCQAALHYADMAVILSEMFGPDAEHELQVEVGKAVQQFIEPSVTRGGPESVQALGEAALAPVLARLNEALAVDAR